ncbi:putative alcohol dehydrogenase, zinc-type, GroES-like superfamily, NAD(P)-binding domain superfamily [Septoria linicola]|nr:putative alcohol dehydrogenase, zinc-type, GroES-like superfamily, NAD(P)-binding domain superfamily [Septoria linicola]
MVSFTVYKGAKDGKVYKATTEKGELERDQVLIKVTASGLCGTDLHYRNADMGLGHEGVGIVEELGPQVTHLKKGDRVGWGYEHNSCGHCQECLKGTETYCPERQLYGMADLDQGSFASHAVWREAFLFKIPDTISDEAAAPLMCGGATVFNALHQYNVQSTETVGIMGVGGLGHLAIQFAAKMGTNVIVLSGSDKKKDEALRLGAQEFIATKDVKEIKPSRPINRLLVTTSAQPDWAKVVPALAPGATIHALSVDEGDFKIPYMALLANGLTVQGSVVASRYIHQRMLEFAALHKIEPIMEKFPMNEKAINEAMDKLNDGNIRYRGVFVPEQ